MIIDKCPFCNSNLIETKLNYSLNKDCKNCLINFSFIDNKLNIIRATHIHNNYVFYQTICLPDKGYHFISYYKKPKDDEMYYEDEYEIEKSNKEYLRGFTKEHFVEFKEAVENISAVRMIFE